MAERGYERDQVRQCLLSGHFIEQPYIPNTSGDIEYKFTIKANVDGMEIVVVASLVPDKKVAIITVYDPNTD